MAIPITEQKIFFFDTETSGFISGKIPYNDPNQAWCVQIGAILANQNEVFEELNIIIQSNGREINRHAEAVHGISAERADEEGVTELCAVNEFGPILRQADLIVCHNADFDWKFVYQLMQRTMDNKALTDEARSAFYLDLPRFCTMKDPAIKKYVDARNVKGYIKWPKLIELYQKLFEKDFENAHDAMADIVATKDCFYELIKRGVIEV